MKKFLIVFLIVLIALGVLAACAPIQPNVEEYVSALPVWVIIVGAVILFFIGFGIIWKLIPGFIKVLAIIALAVILAGTAYGIWRIPLAEGILHETETFIDTLSSDENQD